ncbi:MAG: selenide, water dikinase SelD [Bacteroidales bacterium]|nr:selenide, water dikinase SelD [Bacteroidales bacterium]
MDNIKLTQYSHGAGCGCKISPKVLTTILETNITPIIDKNLLVGNDSMDDAAVYDMGNGTGIISTTDFFMPIVDDPFTFGRIAATNAISDIYAMGGKPVMAIAILGWPINKINEKVARLVVDGGRQACKDAGIILAGGHSIDSPEPIFGLAVTGSVNLENLKRNDTATPDCHLFLTKPLGVGVFSTAQKKGLLSEEHLNLAQDTMSALNTIGYEIALIKGVKAMTDVTGFGLLGHLSEMCEGSKLSAVIEYEKVPKLEMLDYYIDKKCIPGGTITNWDSYGNNVLMDNKLMPVLCDPQTSGGLLIAVEESAKAEVEALLNKYQNPAQSIGYLTEKNEKLITVV